MYEIAEIDAIDHQHTIDHFNGLCPEIFPALEPRHYVDGYWWLAWADGKPVAFAGLVPLEPFAGWGYLKRCYVLPDHHGHGLQYRLMMARLLKARQLGWSYLVSECGADNTYSAANFRKAGFEPCDPEQKWGPPGSLYWIKRLI